MAEYKASVAVAAYDTVSLEAVPIEPEIIEVKCHTFGKNYSMAGEYKLTTL